MVDLNLLLQLSHPELDKLQEETFRSSSSLIAIVIVIAIAIIVNVIIVINSAMNMIITISLSWQPGWLDRLDNLDLALDLKPEVFFPLIILIGYLYTI